MSRGELVDAYQAGKLGRRAFIQGLTALGASMAAANHLADQVHAAPKPSEDVYGNVDDAEPEEVDQLTSLPSTGAGAAADGERQGAGAKRALLGLAGASTAIAAAWLRRWRRADVENE